MREYDASGGPPGPKEDYHLPENIDRKFESLEWIAFEGRTELGILEPSDREVRL